MADNLPDFAYVSSVLHYDPETGVLTWRRRPREHFANANVWGAWNTKYAGKAAGCVERHCRTSYRHVVIDGRSYKAHRIAYLLYTGVWPEGQIDHVDGDGLNNRASNLRDVTNRENACNARMKLNNTSGTNGVYWRKDRRKWKAMVTIHGRCQYIGLFDTLEEATAARLAANAQHGFTERHGASPLDEALAPLFGYGS